MCRTPDRLEAKELSMDHTGVNIDLLAGQVISAALPVVTVTR